MIQTDVLVIGAGSGGLSVAAGAVQMGASVVLLEGHKMGGPLHLPSSKGQTLLSALSVKSLPVKLDEALQHSAV